MIDAALAYLAQGYSVIPCRPGEKRPAIPWEDYQNRRAGEDEIRSWWTRWPSANVAIVCGEISGLTVIDVDGPEGIQSSKTIGVPNTKVVKTPKGFHLYYLYNPDFHTGVAFLPGIDVRSGEIGKENGGYVIAPPSVVDGKPYTVLRDRPVVALNISEVFTSRHRNGRAPGETQPTWVTQALAGVGEGQRNDQGTRLAGYFHSKELPPDVILQILTPFAEKCSPPMTSEELAIIIRSVGRYPPPTGAYPHVKARVDNYDASRAGEGGGEGGVRGVGGGGDVGGDSQAQNGSKRDRNVTENVTARDGGFPGTKRDTNVTQNVTDQKRDRNVTENVTAGDAFSLMLLRWIQTSAGWWTTDELDKEFGVLSIKDRDNRRQVLHRLMVQGVIEKHPKRNKEFRYIDKDLARMHFATAKAEAVVPLCWPFRIEQYVNLYPGNLVVVAGEPNAGKTCFLLNLIQLNQYDFPIYYFCSEMSVEELRGRLDAFGNEVETWNFEAIERVNDFADVIVPDALNIIDFMELTENVYMVNSYLTSIRNRLGKGLAVVALQKKIGASLGRGQEFGLEKPRLYLSMGKGKLTIVKGKSWAVKGVNPNGMSLKFKIVQGSDMIEETPWTLEGE